jgi:hypothetical protein
VQRPKVGFKDTVPKSLSLPLTPPPCFRDKSPYLSALQALMGSRLTVLQEQRVRQGHRVLGRRAVRKTAVTARPSTRKERFGRSPTFSALTRQAWRQAVKRLQGFRAAYRRAYQTWRTGHPDVEFPAGTWWLARCANVTVAT